MRNFNNIYPAAISPAGEMQRSKKKLIIIGKLLQPDLNNVRGLEDKYGVRLANSNLRI